MLEGKFQECLKVLQEMAKRNRREHIMPKEEHMLQILKKVHTKVSI